MLTVVHVLGVDPGLVDTGVVSLTFTERDTKIQIATEVIKGPDAEAVALWNHPQSTPRPHIYVEKYRPRQNLATDKRMVQLEQDLRRELPGAEFLGNMGVKRVVSPELMEALGVWEFPTSTHHQDLRSAARIALLGMLKEPQLNKVLSRVVRDHLDGNPWTIINHG